jgi:ABC-type phosphate/phosphonate transport system substrate-binding protein
MPSFPANRRRPLLLALLALSLGVYAQNPQTDEIPAAGEDAYALLSDLVKTGISDATAASREQFVLSAPTGQPPALRGQEIYGPIAAYLSRVTGKNIVYRQLGDWRSYEKAVRAGQVDLAFDNAAVASWRIAHSDYQPLARMSTRSSFVVLARSGDGQLAQLDDLVGRRLCAPARPHEQTLSVYSRYDNPARQPVLVAISDSYRIYDTLMAGGCDAAIIPLPVYERLGPDSAAVRVLWRGDVTPGPTFSAGPRLSPRDRASILHALLAPEGQKVMDPLRAGYGADRVVAATTQEYAGLDRILRYTWGFDNKASGVAERR